MTKRLIIAVVFLLFSLIVSIFANVYILSSIKELYVLCDNAANVGDEKAFSAILRYWESHRTGFSVFLKHTDADILTRYFSSLENFMYTKNFSEAKRVIFDLKAYLYCTAEGEILKFENIF